MKDRREDVGSGSAANREGKLHTERRAFIFEISARTGGVMMSPPRGFLFVGRG